MTDQKPDIVAQLREEAALGMDNTPAPVLMSRAADEIERLRGEVEAWRALDQVRLQREGERAADRG